LVLTNHIYAESVAAQLPSLPAENILVEPAPRNTAPALAGLRARAEYKQKYTATKNYVILMQIHQGLVQNAG